MRTYRNLALSAGAAIASASLMLAGAVASTAAQPGTSDRAPASGSVVPSSTAPHSGHVAGVQYGPGISANSHAAVHAFRVLHKGLFATGKQQAGPALDTIHVNVGSSFNTDTVGSQASQSVSTKIHAGPNTPVLYTPTMYPSGGSCIEMSTAYFPDQNIVAAWDWCQAITFVAQVNINKKFKKTYTKKGFYSTQILQTDKATNTWTSYLYNYKLDKWETFYSQHGTSQVGLAAGWDIYEIYSELKGDGQSYACDDLRGKTIEAKGIKVGVDGTLVKADPSNSGHIYDHPLSDFHCDDMTYDIVKPYSHWVVTG
jgi:hypothetical protein